MFFSWPFSTSQSVGTFFSKVLTRLRCTVPPNMVQLPEAAGAASGFASAGPRDQAATARTPAKTAAVARPSNQRRIVGRDFMEDTSHRISGRAQSPALGGRGGVFDAPVACPAGASKTPPRPPTEPATVHYRYCLLG